MLLLFEEDHVGDNHFRVGGARKLHLLAVLRVEVGKTLQVGLLEGRKGHGMVTAIEPDSVTIACHFEEGIEARPCTDLVLAVPRPKSLKKILPEVAAIGVDRLVLLRSWKVAKPYLSSPLLAPAQHRALLHEGLMIAKSTREPSVLVETRFRPFVEDRAAQMFGEARLLVAHPGASVNIEEVGIQSAQRVCLAIGPEGGFLPIEIETFERVGFRAVSLGERILRVETACVAALAQINLLRRLSGRASS